MDTLRVKLLSTFCALFLFSFSSLTFSQGLHTPSNFLQQQDFFSSLGCEELLTLDSRLLFDADLKPYTSNIIRLRLIECMHERPEREFSQTHALAFKQSSEQVNKAAQQNGIDTKPPELVSLSLSTHQVDVSQGEQKVTLTVRAKDDSGMGAELMYFYAPDAVGSNFNKYEWVDSNSSSSASRWRETEIAGVYEVVVDFTFDANSPAGIWHGRPFWLADSLGNRSDVFSRETIIESGFNPDLAVINTSVVDMSPPELVSLSLSTHQIDVSQEVQKVTVTVRARDESGMDYQTMYFYAPDSVGSNFNKYEWVDSDSSSSASRWRKTEIAGVYEAQVYFIFDANSPAGIWHGRPIWLTDSLGNRSDVFSRETIVEAGFNPDLTVINTNVVDMSPPELVSLSLSTHQIDVSQGIQKVTIKVRAKDESGIGAELLYFYAPDSMGSNFNKYEWVDSNNSDSALRWRETEIAGVYEAVVDFIFDANSPAGIWHGRPFWLTDNLGNRSGVFNREAIVDAGFNPDLFVNIQPDADIRLSSLQQIWRVKPGLQSLLSFDVSSDLHAALPTELELKFGSDEKLQIQGINFAGLSSFSSSCTASEGVASCRLTLPSGVAGFTANLQVQTQTKGKFQLWGRVDSLRRELNYDNNVLTLDVNSGKSKPIGSFPKWVLLGAGK